MHSLDEVPLEQRAQILAARLERSERALASAETALEARMKELFSANQELALRERELAQKLEIESALLLRALSTVRMATAYGERDRGFSVSESGAALLGLPDGQEATLETVIAALHPLDRERMMRIAMRFFRDAEPGIAHAYTHRIVRGDDGETRWLNWSVKRERGTSERPGHLVATVRDITEERRNERQVRALQLRAERRLKELAKLQAELAGAKQRVEETLADRNRFISEMAHAIRTPLATLSGGLELLSRTLRADAGEELAVAQEAAEQLGEVASKLIEEAARDEISGPATPASHHLHIDPAAIPAQPRVLVAEDTESNRYVAERLLADMGCDVVSVENGAAAVEAVRREHFDVVLMDVMMPIMNGEQATQAIRGLGGPASRTPIIGVTAHSLQSERERLLSAGMTACLAKPVRRETLETSIRTALIAGRDAGRGEAAFDHELFRRAFMQLPGSYRPRLREAAKKDITSYAADVLNAIRTDDGVALSKASHSLTGVALNIGAVRIVEELTAYREKKAKDTVASIEEFREAVAASLLTVDDLYAALIEDGQ